MIGGDGDGDARGRGVIGSGHRRIVGQPHRHRHRGGGGAALPRRKSRRNGHLNGACVLVHRSLVQAQVDAGGIAGHVVLVVVNRHRCPGDGPVAQPGGRTRNRDGAVGRLVGEIVDRGQAERGPAGGIALGDGDAQRRIVHRFEMGPLGCARSRPHIQVHRHRALLGVMQGGGYRNRFGGAVLFDLIRRRGESYIVVVVEDRYQQERYRTRV